MSSRPIINRGNKELINDYLSKQPKLKGKNERDLLIPDPIFAAIINEEREIIVGDSLYKYTEKGLFFGKVQDSIKIRKVSSENNDLQSRIDYCEIRRSEGGIRKVDEGVNRYIARIEYPEECLGGGSSGGGSSGSGTPVDSTTNPETNINNIIQNLSACDGDNNYWLGAFGIYKYCHQYFNNDDYRMQIEFWKENFLIYESIGTKIQTHDEGWFWWNNIDSDELRLGINKVYLKYNIPQPSIETLVPFQGREPIFMSHGQYLDRNASPIQMRSTNLPFFRIDKRNY
ncbi:hypothetical protein [Tenacibaculum maritimum]|uniref:hypothetical protein n=1 Tax=Tenacibaculum maritimum TaxID=107401 RepID=UPI0038908930